MSCFVVTSVPVTGVPSDILWDVPVPGECSTTRIREFLFSLLPGQHPLYGISTLVQFPCPSVSSPNWDGYSVFRPSAPAPALPSLLTPVFGFCGRVRWEHSRAAGRTLCSSPLWAVNSITLGWVNPTRSHAKILARLVGVSPIFGSSMLSSIPFCYCVGPEGGARVTLRGAGKGRRGFMLSAFAIR